MLYLVKLRQALKDNFGYSVARLSTIISYRELPIKDLIIEAKADQADPILDLLLKVNQQIELEKTNKRSRESPREIKYASEDEDEDEDEDSEEDKPEMKNNDDSSSGDDTVIYQPGEEGQKRGEGEDEEVLLVQRFYQKMMQMLSRLY